METIFKKKTRCCSYTDNEEPDIDLLFMMNYMEICELFFFSSAGFYLIFFYIQYTYIRLRRSLSKIKLYKCTKIRLFKNVQYNHDVNNTNIGLEQQVLNYLNT